MNKRIAKPLCIFLTLIMLTGIITAAPLTSTAAGEDEDPVLASGKCGTDENSDVMYFCFKDNSTAILGTGKMMNYSLNGNVSTAPWYSLDFNTIGASLFTTKIAVEYGITSIGDYSFYIGDGYPYESFVQIRNIDISNTVTSIGKYAFYNQKIQQVVLPPTITHIGENAFQKCALTKSAPIIYYGDPFDLTWDGDHQEFPNGITIHILNDYSEHVSEYNRLFAYKNITFVADQNNPYAQAGEDVDRNIAVYYGSVNSNIFGGAAPYVIVGKFDGKKKSVTHGSNGFASCVYDGNDQKYYVLSDNNKGELNEAVCNVTSGKMTAYNASARNDIKLNIHHEYIGANTVKMVYTLSNQTDQQKSNLKLGGTGDIKIGADDFASIEPLMKDGKQVGFYMESTKDYDKSTGGDHATLGFIGKDVDVTGDLKSSADFFYGTVSATKETSAAGAKTVVLIPERIFNMNNGATGTSQATGEYAGGTGKDSGMSFHWDNITLAANESKQFAVLFSVYGQNKTNTMFDEIDASKFCTVTWKNGDDDKTVLLKQVVKKTEENVYPNDNPTRPRDEENYGYGFDKWSDAVTDANGDKEYTAQYTKNETPYKLFTGHSLTLEGDIGLNFYLDVTPDQIAKGSGVVVDFTWTVKGQKKTSQVTLDTSKYTEVMVEGEMKTYYLAQINLPAAEMAYNIHATAKINGKLQTEYNDYSVKEYGEKIVGSDQYNEELKTLIKEMLNYGAKSQVVFDRVEQSSPPANSGINGYVMSNDFEGKTFAEAVNAAVAAEKGNNGNTKTDMREGTDGFGLNYLGSSQVFLTTSTLRHYYTVSNQAAYDSAKNDNPGLFVESKPPFVFVDFTGIPSDKLDLLKEFTVAGHTYRFSVLDYAAAMYEAGNDDEKALAAATYWYSQAANDYFGN